MKSLYAVAVVFSLAASTTCGSTEVTKIDTPRGQSIEVLTDLPKGVGPFPALLLAPGQGYHARLPLMEKLAQSLIEEGVAVVRFDWAYFSKDPKAGKPSEKLASEVEDFRAVLKTVKSNKALDPTQLVLGGKSLGTLVAWRVFRDDASARAALLLTPVCVSQVDEKPTATVFENYEGLKTSNRPILLLSGESDPICPSKFLYSAAAQIQDQARVVVTGGDHSFRTKEGANPAQQSVANLDLATKIATDFVVSKLRR